MGDGFAVRPFHTTFGAEIVGVDLCQPLPEEAEKAIQDVWIDKGVLLFRNDAHDDSAHMRLSRLFGDLEPGATPDRNDPENNYLKPMLYDPADKVSKFPFLNVDGVTLAGWIYWHWDQPFMPTIIRAAALRMVKPARLRGETGFIDAIEAYDRLPSDIKSRIDDLEVVYQYNSRQDGGVQFGFPANVIRADVDKEIRESIYDFPPVVHPLVIAQKETGRKVLKLSPMHARYILGIDRNDSDELLTYLASHIIDDRFAYYHKWQENDILIWDNWRMIHRACGVPMECLRSARRTTIAGDYGFGRYLDPKLGRTREVERIID